MRHGIDPERLAAYADGALDPAEAAEVAAHLATHAGDAAWVEAIRAQTRSLRAAFVAPMHEPVPEAIAALLRAPQGTASGAAQPMLRAIAGGGDRIALGPRGPRSGAATTPDGSSGARVVPMRRRRAPIAGLALAASLAALVLVGVAGRDGGAPGPVAALVPGPVAADSALALALADAPSGTARRVADVEAMPLLSFLDAAGRPCREVAHTAPGADQVAIVCRGDAGAWRVEAVAARAAPDAVPGPGALEAAAGAEGDPIAAALDRLGAGPGLDPAAEAALIARGWAPAP